MANTISSLVASLGQQVQAQTRIAQSQETPAEQSQDESTTQTGIISVVEALAPNSLNSQAMLGALAPALKAPVEGRIAEALQLTGEFHNNLSTIQPALLSFEATLAASQSRGIGPANQVSISSQFTAGLRQFASIFGGQGIPYSSVTPDPIILAIGAPAENGSVVNLLL